MITVNLSTTLFAKAVFLAMAALCGAGFVKSAVYKSIMSSDDLVLVGLQLIVMFSCLFASFYNTQICNNGKLRIYLGLNEKVVFHRFKWREYDLDNFEIEPGFVNKLYIKLKDTEKERYRLLYYGLLFGNKKVLFPFLRGCILKARQEGLIYGDSIISSFLRNGDI